MAVKQAPNELTGDVLQSEYEVGVLVDGVVPTVERSSADGVPLPIRDLGWLDDTRHIACACGSNREVEGVLEVCEEPDPRSLSLQPFSRVASHFPSPSSYHNAWGQA